MDLSLQEANQKIDNALSHLKKELSSIRAGRANPALIEGLEVSVYGSKMKLMELGTISAPQSNLLTVQVWDGAVVKDIEKAILESNMGLNPSIDGQTVRLPIPPLSEERREEFTKLAHQKGEEVKIEIRQVRGDQRNKWVREKDEGDFGENELERREKILQELIDKSVAAVDGLVEEKVMELKKI